MNRFSLWIYQFDETTATTTAIWIDCINIYASIKIKRKSISKSTNWLHNMYRFRWFGLVWFGSNNEKETSKKWRRKISKICNSYVYCKVIGIHCDICVSGCSFSHRMNRLNMCSSLIIYYYYWMAINLHNNIIISLRVIKRPVIICSMQYAVSSSHYQFLPMYRRMKG